jgi:tryptophanyl-tRNA synthetase
MSLRDAGSKMSKSDPAEGGRILLTDTPDEILKKVRRAKTDGMPGLQYDPETRPERSNLLRIFSAVLCSDEAASPQQLAARFADADTLLFKNALAEAIIARVEPIRLEIVRLEQDPVFLQRVLDEGAHKAASAAEDTMVRVRAAMGLAA